jgi:hypothetical protein
MQTRIEARRTEAPRTESSRMDPLRADPEMAVTYPHVEPDPWRAPPPTATMPLRPARRTTGRGTGWAIGLGAALLIIGLTAPAAILQQRHQGQTDQNQVAINQAPTPKPDQPAESPAGTQAPPGPQTEAAAGTQAPPAAEADSSAAPTEAAAARQSPPAPATPAAPDVQHGNSEPGQSLAAKAKPDDDKTAPKQESGNTSPQREAKTNQTRQAARTQQAAPGPVREGRELKKAPVLVPPPPREAPLVNLASREKDDSSAAYRPSPMVARPFIPDQTQPSFLRPPIVGTATVPISGAAPNSFAGASVGVRPSLIPQLKPSGPAKAMPVSPEAFTPKPFGSQSVEEMFQSLVDTLTQSKAADPGAGQPSDR